MAIHPGLIFGLLKEMRVAASDERSLVVAGARELANVLARELGRDAAPGAVRTEGDLERAAALIYVPAGAPTDEDVAALRLADLGGVPIICVRSTRGGEPEVDVPYVLATDIVDVPPGAGFPIEDITAKLAARLGEKGTNVARRVPVLRDPVARHLVSTFSTKAGWTAGAWFIPGGEFLPLTVQQVRLVLRIAHVYGHDVDPMRTPEVIGVIAGAYGWRAVARRALRSLPAPDWAVRGAVAYGATRAVGEAAIRRFSAAAETPTTQPPASAASAAP